MWATHDGERWETDESGIMKAYDAKSNRNIEIVLYEQALGYFLESAANRGEPVAFGENADVVAKKCKHSAPRWLKLECEFSQGTCNSTHSWR